MFKIYYHYLFLILTVLNNVTLPFFLYIESKEKRSGSPAKKIVELGIFIDDKAFDIYYEYFNARSTKETKKKIIFLVLAVMNGVQAVYHYPTLSEAIDFRIVYLEVQESRKIDHYGEQGHAYESFCKYQHNVMEGNK